MAVMAVLMAVVAFFGIWINSCGGYLETTTGSTVPMKCHWTSRVAIMLGIISLVMVIIGMFAHSGEGRRMVLLALILLMLSVLLLETVVIGVCNGSSMTCQIGRRVEIVTPIISIIYSAVLIVKCNPSSSSKPRRSL